MRKQFVKTVESIMEKDDRVVLLLGDIGVFGFRNVFKQYPERAYNIGICEQAMTSLAAGLAKEGFIPILHSIAPFVVERCYEQLKVDLCYQGLNVNIVSVGASYDYAALGCTHHCPGDIAVLKALPGMEIIVPGTAHEFDLLFSAAYSNSRPTYFRLSERGNQMSHEVELGNAVQVQRGSSATIVAVGPTLDWVLDASQGYDVTILYYTSINPFDEAAIRTSYQNGKFILVEPYYSGTLVPDIVAACGDLPASVKTIGVPHKFITEYGHAERHDEIIGLTAKNIRDILESVIFA
jgi:transketolase